MVKKENKIYSLYYNTSHNNIGNLFYDSKIRCQIRRK